MNTSRLLLGAVILCALPSHAQPEVRPANDLPFPVVPLDEAIRLIQPDKPVALHLRDITLQDALTELARQFNTRFGHPSGINVPQALATKLSIDIETASFKEAFNAIIKAANVRAQIDRLQLGDISVVFGGNVAEDDKYLSGKPPFGIRLQDISSSRLKTVILGKTPSRIQNSEFHINLQSEIGPEIPIIGSGRLRVTRIEDEQGRSLKVIDDRAMLMGLPDYARGPQMDVHLRPPEAGSQQLSHFEGIVNYVLPTKYEKWEVADVLSAKNLKHEFKGTDRTISVTIIGAQSSKTGLHLELEVSSPVGGKLMNGGVFSTLSVTQLVSAIGLKDANGQMPGRRGVSQRGTDDKVRVQVDYILPEPDDNPFTAKRHDGQTERTELTGPISFTVNIPTEMIQTEVPFSFSDVPLP
ncbi:hypothetical protein EON83_03635 [bacterium]|nr:MAG: hypothetical protein EON83_03635 [bacterium]